MEMVYRGRGNEKIKIERMLRIWEDRLWKGWVDLEKKKCRGRKWNREKKIKWKWYFVIFVRMKWVFIRNLKRGVCFLKIGIYVVREKVGRFYEVDSVIIIIVE